MATLLRIKEILNRRNIRRERIFRDRTEVLDTLTDTELIARYRFPRHTILQLVDRVSAEISRPTQRSCALPVHVQVLVTLRYFSKGGFLSELGDIHGIAKSSVCRVLEKTTDAIVKSYDLIRFRTPDKHAKLAEDFFHICGFPKVVGCIDCTLIPIQRPALDEAVYMCRKGFHAINVQAVCDAQLRFTNIIVQWPGSTHDSHIFNNCNLKRHLEEGKYDIWLLGDSGYACRPYLLTPVNNPANEKEEKYNRCHIGTRNSVERAFGLCKSRFRCLHKTTGCLLFSPQKSIKIITACFQLHNLAILLRLPEPDVLCENPGPEVDSSPADNHNMDGCRVRGNLINSRF
ncbi:putative nuclease HARBI1 [Haliotis rufescens]|uniref:putative nuclease HARBI1 n=1 Tax=Haliotis rufescens TaxID=6454 RepID=UPI00201F517B|nr:putative nuclease HARBI1 [Haliotis rufescens]